MKNKEKQRCETVGDVLNKIGYYKKRFKHTEEINALIRLISKLSNENIKLKKKLPDSIVLSRKELSNRDYEFRQIGYDECLRDNPKKDKYIKTLERKIDQLNAKLDQTSKETAEKILKEIWHNKFETIITIKNSCSKEDIENVGKEILISIRNKLKEIATREGVEIKE